MYLTQNQVTSSPKEQDYFSDVFLKKKLFLKPFKGEMMIITHNHQLNGYQFMTSCLSHVLIKFQSQQKVKFFHSSHIDYELQ